MKQFLFKVTVVLPNQAKCIFYCCEDNISNVPYHFSNVTFRGEDVIKYISTIQKVEEYDIIGYGEKIKIPYGTENEIENDIV